MKIFNKESVVKRLKDGLIEPIQPSPFALGKNQTKKVDWTPYRDIKGKSVKIKIPESLHKHIEEYAEMFGDSESSIIRKALFFTIHGRYRYDQMSSAEDGLFFKEAYSGALFSLKRSDKKQEDLRASVIKKAPQLGKNNEDLRVWLPKQLYDELKQIVDKKKLPLSAYCRQALIAYFMGELQFK